MEPQAAPSNPEAGIAPSLPPPSLTPPPTREPATEGGAASQGSGGWLRNALSAVTGRTALRSQPEASADEQPEGEQPDADWTAPTWATKREYDDWLHSQNRSFADRQDRERDRRATRDREAERDQRIAGYEADKVTARTSGDTWRVGELQDLIDAERAGIATEHDNAQALNEFVGTLRAEFDSIYLDPVMRQLPQAQARALLSEHSMKGDDGKLLMAPDGQPVGVLTTEARSALFTSALKALLDGARDEGAARARKDPTTRKELMAEFMTGPDAAAVTPVQVGGARGGGAPSSMNDWLRSARQRRS